MGKMHLNKTDSPSNIISSTPDSVDNIVYVDRIVEVPVDREVEKIIYIDKIVPTIKEVIREVSVLHEVPVIKEVIQVVEKIVIKEVPVIKEIILYDEVKIARLNKSLKKEKQQKWILVAVLILSLVLEMIVLK